MSVQTEITFYLPCAKLSGEPTWETKGPWHWDKLWFMLERRVNARSLREQAKSLSVQQFAGLLLQHPNSNTGAWQLRLCALLISPFSFHNKKTHVPEIQRGRTYLPAHPRLAVPATADWLLPQTAASAQDNARALLSARDCGHGGTEPRKPFCSSIIQAN